MLSRVASHIYWLGRYLERAENYARFIDVNFNLMQDLPMDLKEQWGPLVAATGDLELYRKKYTGFERHQVMFFLTFDTDNPNSMLNAVKNSRENARIIRENLSKETWEKVNELYYMMQTGLEKKKSGKGKTRGSFTSRLRIRFCCFMGWLILLWHGRKDGTFGSLDSCWSGRIRRPGFWM